MLELLHHDRPRLQGRRPYRVLLWLAAAILSTASHVSAVEPPVTALTFTPDGQSVVVGSQAGLSVFAWPTLKRSRTIKTTILNLHDLAFSPDGKTLAVVGGTPAEEGQIELVQWKDGLSQYLIKGNLDSLVSVAWKDHATLATASLDHDITIWNVNSRKPVQHLKGHSRGVTTLCFLSEGRLLISGGLDNNVRVWDVRSGSVVRSLNNHTKQIHQIALRPSPDGLPMIASVSSDRSVRLWQPTIGRMVRFTRLKSVPLAVEWLPDGSRLAIASADGCVRLINPDTAEVIETLPAVTGWAYSLAAHPHDGSLVVGGRNGQLTRVIPTAR